MKLLVCGPRDWRQSWYVFDVLNDWFRTQPDIVPAIITGGAKGVDTMAIEWAKGMALPHHVYPAQWHLHGKAAGPIRNQRMLDEGKPDLVYAFGFNDRDELTSGTANMVQLANRAKLPVHVFRGPR